MKLRFASFALIAFAALPAQAARVTNLDTIPHIVTFAQAGSVSEQTIQPDSTAYFPRMDGVISLKGGVPAKSTLNSDGLLSGVIGAGRTTQIPAGPYDDFVIWKGGEMHLQRRQIGQMHGG